MRSKFNAAFWKWFGDSKVVDSKGNPLVVYHGSTEMRRISQFSMKSRSLSSWGDAALGHFFSESKTIADAFKEVFTYSVYLKIERPIYYSGQEFFSMSNEETGMTISEFKALRRKLIRGGVDGVIISADKEIAKIPGWIQYGADTFVAFHSNQIKDAINNDGTWDFDDPDIRSNPQQFWGRAGAGILFFCPRDNTLMLTLRSDAVEQPGTFGIPGGSCSGEDFYDASEGKKVSNQELWDCAVRETTEELGYFPEEYEVADKFVYKNGNFTYTTFVLIVTLAQKKAMNESIELNWESDSFAWRKLDSWLKLDNLHFGARWLFEQLAR